MSKTVRSIILFGAPVFVGVLNLFHPTQFDYHAVYDGLHGVAAWWITLHLLNLFGFAALGLAGYLFILERRGAAANLAKAALLVFVPTYVGFDSIVGIGTGILMRYGNTLPAAALNPLKTTINIYWNSDISMLLAVSGSIAWSVAMGATAVSLALSRRGTAVAIAVFAGVFTGWGNVANTFGTWPWWIGLAAMAVISYAVVRPSPAYALLIAAGILLGTSHTPPFGPLGMLCFLAAVALVEWVSRVENMLEIAATGHA